MVWLLMLVFVAYLLCGSWLRLVFWAWALAVTLPFAPLIGLALLWEFLLEQAVRLLDGAMAAKHPNCRKE